MELYSHNDRSLHIDSKILKRMVHCMKETDVSRSDLIMLEAMEMFTEIGNDYRYTISINHIHHRTISFQIKIIPLAIGYDLENWLDQIIEDLISVPKPIKIFNYVVECPDLIINT